MLAGNIFNEKSNPNQSSVVVAGHEVNLTKGGGAGRSRSGGGKINKRFHGLVPDDAAGVGAGVERDADTCSVSQSLMMMRMTTPPPPSSSLGCQRDRNKLCGSLPDYLDTNDDDEVDFEERAGNRHQKGGYIVDQLQLTESFCGEL